MEEILREPVELIDDDLDQVAGGAVAGDRINHQTSRAKLDIDVDIGNFHY